MHYVTTILAALTESTETVLIGQLGLFATLVLGYVYTAWKEGRRRKWDVADRAELARLTRHTAANVAQAVQSQSDVVNEKLANAAGKLDQIQLQTNGELERLRSTVIALSSEVKQLHSVELSKLTAELERLKTIPISIAQSGEAIPVSINPVPVPIVPLSHPPNVP